MRKRKSDGWVEKLIKKQKVQIQLPDALWFHIAKFLHKRELYFLTYLDTDFLRIACRAMINFYRDKFIYFPFSIESTPLDRKYSAVSNSIQSLKKINIKGQYYHYRYYTLFDPDYVELFEAIEAKDSEKAKIFIQARIIDNRHNVVDRVFSQKNGQGETVISLANRYGLQDFLNFCFKNLILEGYRLNKDRYSLVKTGDYSRILATLDHTMSNEALWMFACAYVCNQTGIWNVIIQKQAWRSTWQEEDESPTLTAIATLLSSLDLVMRVLRGLDREQTADQLFEEINFGNLYITHSIVSYNPLEIAALGKNRAIIDYLFLKLKSKGLVNRAYSELLCYFIECHDIQGFKVFYSNDLEKETSGLLNRYLNIDSNRKLTIMGVAIAKNWMPGVRFMVQRGLPLNSRNFLSLAVEFDRVEIVKYLLSKGANPNYNNPDIKNLELPPVFKAVKQNNLKLVKLLVDKNASLEIKCENLKYFPPYPLIGAILNENEAMTQYIIRKLGSGKTFEQLLQGLLIYVEYKKENGLIFLALSQQISHPLEVRDSPFLPVEEKKSSENKFMSGNRINWLMRLPRTLWILAAGFLEEKDLLHLFQTNHTVFAFSVLQRTIDIYDFAPRMVNQLINFSKNLYGVYSSFHPRYYTLVDYDYIKLFRLVEKFDLSGIKAFIQSRKNNPNLLDMIAYQKDGFGNTTLTLAAELGFQGYLDYCFNIFVVNSDRVVPRGIVALGNYDLTLSSLDSKMSEDALWLFAFAYVCNQHDLICIIKHKPHWNKSWFPQLKNLSLGMIAVILSSESLLDYAFRGMNENALERPCHEARKKRYPFELYTNTKDCYLSIGDMASISKNRKLIEVLFVYSTSWSTEEFFFYIENKDIVGLKRVCRDYEDQDCLIYDFSHFPNANFRIQSHHPLLPIGAAIAKNWFEGVQCILENTCYSLSTERYTDLQDNRLLPNSLIIAVSLGRTKIVYYLLLKGAHPDGFNDPEVKEPAPIYYAIENNRLDLVQLLVMAGASLQIANKAYPLHISPLISAILNGYSPIWQFLVTRMGINNSLHQIKLAAKARKADQPDFAGLREYSLLKNAFTQIVDAANRATAIRAEYSGSSLES